LWVETKTWGSRNHRSSFAGNIKWPDGLFVVDVPEERKPMLKKLAFATAAMALITCTASADYYIVQEKATKKC
jgi:hypothetical protein